MKKKSITYFGILTMLLIIFGLNSMNSNSSKNGYSLKDLTTMSNAFAENPYPCDVLADHRCIQDANDDYKCFPDTEEGTNYCCSKD